ncbi:MAG: ECF transporter S component [Eubacteriales bacterium]|nr:ECF transporter S component [Eubacteriales bacterium]
MKKADVRKQVLTALFTALICVATMVIQIPTPMTGGYVNVGDVFVLAAAWFLGPWYGMFAAGVGSALADLLSSYAHYIPGTLIIKALMALTAALIAKRLRERIPSRAGRLVGAIAAELIMVAGYFLYAWAILGKAVTAAVTSVPENLLQGAVGIVGGMMLIEVLNRLPIYGKDHRAA